jgi:uncharacterized membrane protein
MAPIISGYLCTLVAFAIVDFAWLSVMAGRFYRPILGDILLPEVNLKAAAAFYLIYPIGLTIFAVAPALKSGDLKDAALMGALFGFFAYATYDLTNQATVRNWSVSLTLVDVIWGTFASGLAAFVAAAVSTKIG